MVSTHVHWTLYVWWLHEVPKSAGYNLTLLVYICVHTQNPLTCPNVAIWRPPHHENPSTSSGWTSFSPSKNLFSGRFKATYHAVFLQLCRPSHAAMSTPGRLHQGVGHRNLVPHHLSTRRLGPMEVMETMASRRHQLGISIGKWRF